MKLKLPHWLQTIYNFQKRYLEIIKATVRAYTLDGTVLREQQERIVDFQRKQLKVDRVISPNVLYDFSLLRTLNDELKRTRF